MSGVHTWITFLSSRPRALLRSPSLFPICRQVRASERSDDAARRYSPFDSLRSSLTPSARFTLAAVAVSACSTHTAVISRSGQVYTWGTTTRSGSLGVEGRKHISVPIKVEGVRRCVGVSVGQEHTVLLSAFGRPPLNPYDDVEEEEGEDLRFEAEEGLRDGGVELEEGDDLDTTLDTLDSSIEPHEPPLSTPRPLLSLQRQCEVTIARQVDTHNVIAILEKAASFFSMFLMDYCFDFLGNNLDGVLERLAGEKRRAEFEFLVDIITGGGGDDEEMQESLR